MDTRIQQRAIASAERISLLQQIVLPHSSIHRDETAGLYDANGLRDPTSFWEEMLL